MSNQQLINFSNPDFGKVRALLIDGEPWLVGKDVATALGYKNPERELRKHVDAEDKGVTEMVTPGGKQKITVINESGMYSLILSSKLPDAKKFKRWVTSEVLPSIRKTGSYSINRDERWLQTRLNSKKSHKPYTAAIKILIGYLRQFGDEHKDGYIYGHITNIMQDAIGIIKGQRDFADVASLNRCDQCQNMIANLILNFVAQRRGKTLAEVDAAIILHLNRFNNLLSGQILIA